MLFVLILICLFLTAAKPNELFAQATTTASAAMQELINEALNKNPDYLSAQKQLQSVNAQIPQAGAMPDPTLSFAIMNLPVNSYEFDQEPMTGKKLSLMQMFPFPGKLRLKENIAEYQAQVVQHQVEELKNLLIRNVKMAYFNLFLIDKSVEVVEKNTILFDQVVKVAESKYTVGKGLQQDVLKAQVEMLKLADKLISLQQKRDNFVYQLNKLSNRSVTSPIGMINDIPESTFEMEVSQLRELGLMHRPLLKGWQFMIEKSKSTHALAKLEYVPDFSLGVAYTQRDDLKSGLKMHDFLSAEFKIKLPIYFYKKQSKNSEQTQLTVNSLEDKYRDVKNEVLFQIENTYSELKKNEKLKDLYLTGIIPQARGSLNSAMSGYQVGNIDFITLLDNQLTLLKYELEFYKVSVDYSNNIAQLEAVIGKELISY